MSRRWAPAKNSPQQIQLHLEQRGRFSPPIKLATETSAAAAASVGIKRSGDAAPAPVGGLAEQLAGIIEDHSIEQGTIRRRDGVQLALQVRGQVLEYLQQHLGGATADEIAYALQHSILTVRPRVSELGGMGLIVDSLQRRPNVSGRNAIVWQAAELRSS